MKAVSKIMISTITFSPTVARFLPFVISSKMNPTESHVADNSSAFTCFGNPKKKEKGLDCKLIGWSRFGKFQSKVDELNANGRPMD
ncbi:hypothetical protein BB560_002459 [Smittium megazygosporum]|uniref:Uncharacterized protein n=1 Tax=Smittium megazygosporum TaxID=133381 RepID=A0A2T9ZEP2_9FUNG|nr:hypothetical protein BB560_002461 [Smittium megazygosporum]PVV03074.1 hypothetical protein BB560_002459 [Smittium megazygosporum]